MGLNPGTAIYAYLMAKRDNEVTIVTSLNEDYVELTDLKLHTILGVINPQVNRLFSVKYLEDVLGIDIIRTGLNHVKVTGNNKMLIDEKYYHFDNVIVGNEVKIKDWDKVIQELANTKGGVKIVSNDTGLSLATALLLSELGNEVYIDMNNIPIDEDLLRLLPIKYSVNYEKTLVLNYDIEQPIINGAELLGKGATGVDLLSGLSYVVTGDYELIIRGKLMALRDLGLINGKPVIPRLEVGLGVNWSYVTIGLERNALIKVYRDLSSSKISYRQDGKDIVVKALYRGGKLLGMQFVIHGVKNLNWIYSVYALILSGNTPFLLLDMGYEDFGTVRGLLEHLIMDVLSI